MTATSVVLVHGLWMNGWEMFLLRRRLQTCGYRVYRYYYRTVGRDLEWNAARLERFLKDHVEGTTVHLVAHSLGGPAGRSLSATGALLP